MVSAAVPDSLESPGAAGTLHQVRGTSISQQRSGVPTSLLFNSERDFTALEIRVWSLLDSESVKEVGGIARRLDIHRGSVSRALAHLTSYGFAARNTAQYRNPRTGRYDILVYSALDGPPFAIVDPQHTKPGRQP